MQINLKEKKYFECYVDKVTSSIKSLKMWSKKYVLLKYYIVAYFLFNVISDSYFRWKLQLQNTTINVSQSFEVFCYLVFHNFCVIFKK